MTRLIERQFADSPVIAFDHIKDRSVIATLNHTQIGFLDDGCRLYEYIKDGVLQSRKINIEVNREWVFPRNVDGKKEYVKSADFYEELLKERYRGKPMKAGKGDDRPCCIRR